LEKFELLSIEHRDYRSPEDVVRRLRRPAVRDIADEPLPSLRAGGLPSVFVVQAVATNAQTGESGVLQHLFKDMRQEEVEWVVYQAETFAFVNFTWPTLIPSFGPPVGPRNLVPSFVSVAAG